MFVYQFVCATHILICIFASVGSSVWYSTMISMMPQRPFKTNVVVGSDALIFLPRLIFICRVFVVLLPQSFCFPLFMQLLQNSVSVAFPRLAKTKKKQQQQQRPQLLIFKRAFCNKLFLQEFICFIAIYLSLCLSDCLPAL